MRYSAAIAYMVAPITVASAYPSSLNGIPTFSSHIGTAQWDIRSRSEESGCVYTL